MQNPLFKFNSGLRVQSWPFLFGVVVTIFIVISIVNFVVVPKQFSSKAIKHDLHLLHDTFIKIDDACRILSFDKGITPINFLNVKSFAGSEVGSMSLAYPDKWQGPYLARNPHLQNIEYQMVVTKKGYFITPGAGVKLPNGKTMGKDIMLDENSDIEQMMLNKNILLYDGQPLAVQVQLKTNQWQKLLLENLISEDDPSLMSKEKEKPAGVQFACSDGCCPING